MTTPGFQKEVKRAKEKKDGTRERVEVSGTGFTLKKYSKPDGSRYVSIQKPQESKQEYHERISSELGETDDFDGFRKTLEDRSTERQKRKTRFFYITVGTCSLAFMAYLIFRSSCLFSETVYLHKPNKAISPADPTARLVIKGPISTEREIGIQRNGDYSRLVVESNDVVYGAPQWSPSGRHVACKAVYLDWHHNQNEYRIVLASTNSQIVKQLPGTHFCFSPTGSHLVAFTPSRGENDYDLSP